MAELNGAEIITEHLAREKVPYAVGLCGHGDLGLLDALAARSDEIQTISVHHESVAGFIADAYYRVRRQPLAAFTSCGPGAANLLVALGSALMDSSALLAITGNVPTTQFNRSPFQELGYHYQADFPSAARHYVKRSFQATRAAQLPLVMRQAFATMTGGRPGPVHVDVPLDVFAEDAAAEPADPGLWRGGVSGRTAAAADEIDVAVDLLLSARRPVIVAGHGLGSGDAARNLLELATAAGIPFVTSPLGKDLAAPGSPLYAGVTGRNGTYPANRAARGADVILALGTIFDDRSTSSWLPGYTYAIPPARLVHVDADPAVIGRNYPAALGVAASPAEVLRQLIAALAARGTRAARGQDAGHDAGKDASEYMGGHEADRRRWLAEIDGWRAEWERHIAPGRSSAAVPIGPARVLAALRAALPADGILLSDVGAHHNWVVQEWQPSGPGSLLQSWGFAAMGFGVAGALGARLAAPERPVAAVVGDGGFLMLPSVIATAVEYDLPAVWLVWNNGGFISIRDQQRGYFGTKGDLATTFRSEKTGKPYTADYAAMARAMGAEGFRAEDPGSLGDVLTAALESGRPAVVDVAVDADAAQPAVGSWELPPLPHPEPSFGWPDHEPPGDGVAPGDGASPPSSAAEGE
ncbi:MAG: thiamine pyrophosphate-binding protein [Nocardiopsaceae bacterium]|nr:thiamine pyrophosphate-binding protein [Nocardiopsaceae bacterium]